ncbi:1,4-alpha-glucan branching enzyme [Brevinema andersonii]|uniref:1,4-alpha-glucan branching enzyme n=1 Tax=Brevinema andersonii TaxID=34097 RepID=A0A1I1DWS5_BREAD|nr:1,4-alpha-glucan branching protein domain-containing protein [Brevinema andersonii]SFB77160.1 1,4-alpha-glucan branching enzyme [Brevinema andersonii]
MNSFYFMLVLHAHMPYVMGTSVEYWLHEAVLHSYLPLLEMLERCLREELSVCITLNMSPILLNQLTHSDFVENFLEYLQQREQNLSIQALNPEVSEILQNDLQKLCRLKTLFLNEWNRDIVGQFKKFVDLGYINVTTSSATHAYLPLWEADIESVYRQIAVGKVMSSFYFGDLNGFWSPECGVFPDLTSILKEFEFSYFFADPAAVNTEHIFQPFTDRGVYYFVRDIDISMKIWDSDEGYPGHPLYRDFHSDFFTDPESCGRITERAGFSIRAVTNKNSNRKDIYCPVAAHKQAELDAQDFCSYLACKFKKLSGNCCSIFFDAELFGHWWYEGVDFLYYLCRALSRQNVIKLTFPLEILQKVDSVKFSPMYSSWGLNHDAGSWLNAKTYFLWEKIYNTSPETCSMRNLLLAQASDWMFLITHNSFIEFSKNRISRLLSYNNDADQENDLLQQSISVCSREDFFAI